MKVLIIIILVLTVFLLIPIGIDGGYKQNSLILGIKIGPINFKLFPRKTKLNFKAQKLKKAKKKKKKPAAELTEGQDEEPKKKKRPDFKQIMDIISIGLKALKRFRRKLNIDYLRIHYTFASDDPFNVAMGYAAANATISAIFPLVDDAFNIRERDFGIYADFCTYKPRIDVWLTATVNLLDLCYIAIAFAIDYLKLKIKKKRSKRTDERNDTNGQKSN